MDKIIVKDLELFCYHGVNPEEKEDGQIFVFDIEAGVDLTKPCESVMLTILLVMQKLLRLSVELPKAKRMI